MSLQKLMEILSAASQHSEQRQQLIAEFQKAVWDAPENHSESWECQVLRDLAYDLDYYEPDASKRAEDVSYTNDEQVVAEIKSALEKLQKAGHKL